MADSSPNERSCEPLVVIGGPTASGKSPLALGLAEIYGGEIINGDSMQVYDELRLLTARPGPDDERRVPHHLYGFMSVAERCSVALWADQARRVARECLAPRKRAHCRRRNRPLSCERSFAVCRPYRTCRRRCGRTLWARVDGLAAEELHDLARTVDPDLAQRIPGR